MRRAKHADSDGSGLVKMLRDLYTTFGIAEELASDGGPQFTSADVQKFLHRYGVKHRLSLLGNPHSDQRAVVQTCFVRVLEVRYLTKNLTSLLEFLSSNVDLNW